MEFVGKTLGNRYFIEEPLGGGGMALVYRARCNFLNREVTVKILRPQFNDDVDVVERFKREALAVAKLSHPNIVNVYDTGEQNGVHYMVMEYVEGRNLKEIIKDEERLSVDKAVSIAKQICAALDHAHENGIIHRDIKPHNILVAKNGGVKVTDFGIARATAESSVTQTGTIVGSVHYISPEQAKGVEADIRSDLYSVGIVLYEMVTGKIPFEGDSPIAVAMKHIEEEPELPSSLNSEISTELEQIILRAIAKDPENRYQGAIEMIADLSTVLSGYVSDKTMLMTPDEYATTVLKKPVTEEGKKKVKKGIGVNNVVVAVLVILGLLSGAYVAFNRFMAIGEVVVPDLTNKTREEASQILDDKGLKLLILDREYNDDVEEGNIIRQNPEENEVVRPNREIEVIISQGPEMFTVPDLTNLNLREAEIELKNNQLKIGSVDEIHDEFIEKGKIIEQDPRFGQKVEKDRRINVTVSLGKEVEFVKVPNVVGITRAEARVRLDKANLVLDEEVTEVESTQYYAGIIVEQDPAYGPNVLVEEGSKVRVSVSSGPGPAPKYEDVFYLLPPAVDEAQVTVVVKDIKEPSGREVYSEELEGGSKVQLQVQVFPPASIEIYVDGELVDGKEVN